MRFVIRGHFSKAEGKIFKKIIISKGCYPRCRMIITERWLGGRGETPGDSFGKCELYNEAQLSRLKYSMFSRMEAIYVP